MLDTTAVPTAALYILLGLITLGWGVGVLVFQTGATDRALSTRRGLLFGGVLLVLFGGAVLLTQVVALIAGSYAVTQ